MTLILSVVRPSVCLSVRPSFCLSVRLSHFWFADNFFTLRDRAFIFGKCVPYRTGIRQGTLDIVIEEVFWSIRGSYQTIWSFPLTNVKWHSVNWPYTMTTPYWSDFVPNSTFYRILSGFHRTSATGVACRQGTLTPPDTWSRPLGTCICSTCWDQFFSELVVIFPDYALRISLGTFSIFLMTRLFRWYHKFWSRDLDRDLWPTFGKLQLCT